eukprot:762509-Hanusia_phi.AAC.1
MGGGGDAGGEEGGGRGVRQSSVSLRPALQEDDAGEAIAAGRVRLLTAWRRKIDGGELELKDVHRMEMTDKVPLMPSLLHAFQAGDAMVCVPAAAAEPSLCPGGRVQVSEELEQGQVSEEREVVLLLIIVITTTTTIGCSAAAEAAAAASHHTA